MARPDQIVFGTMRLSLDADVGRTADFLKEIYARGVRSLHCSSEYDTFALLVAVLKRLRSAAPEVQFRFIAKLAEPGFDDSGFDEDRLIAKIDAYRAALGIDTVDDLQWMWRSSLDDDAARIRKFEDERLRIFDAFEKMKAQSWIKRAMCFPYSPEFARACVGSNFDGMLFYRNDQERDYDDLLDPLASHSQQCFVIRPFFGGKCLQDGGNSPRQQLDRTLDHQAIEGAILSTSQLSHLDQLID